MKRKIKGSLPGRVISLLVLLFLVFVILFPFIWMVVTSFKAEADIVSWPPKLFS